MTITIVSKTGDFSDPAGALYPNHSSALAFRPTTTFRSKSSTSSGVFPNETFTGSDIANQFHIHRIDFAGVISRVCVTFLKDGDHVAYAFYLPDPATSSTFHRYLRKSFDDTMRTTANSVFEEFIESCPTMPAIEANAAVVAFINQKALLAAQEAAASAAAASAAFSAITISSSSRDQSLFGQVAKTGKPRTDSEVDAICAAYLKAGGAGFDRDLSMVKTALRDRKPRESWNKFIEKYYDGLEPHMKD